MAGAKSQTNLKEDEFIQEWHTQLQKSNKSKNYRIYKTDFKFEDYLTKLQMYI